MQLVNKNMQPQTGFGICNNSRASCENKKKNSHLARLAITTSLYLPTELHRYSDFSE